MAHKGPVGKTKMTTLMKYTMKQKYIQIKITQKIYIN